MLMLSIIARTAWLGRMAIIMTDCCHSTRAGPAEEPAGAERGRRGGMVREGGGGRGWGGEVGKGRLGWVRVGCGRLGVR